MQFPFEIDGWLTELEGTALAELATGKRVLEIGSYCGRSTVCMAQTAITVWSVDPHNGHGTPKQRDTFAEFQANLARYNLTNVNSIRGTLREGYEFPYRFGLVFIDGDHSRQAVQTDIEDAICVLEDDGLIAFHDYRLRPGEHDGRFDIGVTDAVNELLANGAQLLSRHGTVALVKPTR